MKVKKFRTTYISALKIVLVLFLVLTFTLSLISNHSIVKSTSAMFLIFYSFLILYVSHGTREKIFSAAYYFISFYLVKFNIIEFNFIPQAKALLDINPSLNYWIYNNNPHFIRLLIAYPGYLLSELYEISLNTGFSYYIIFILNLLYLIFAKEIIPNRPCVKNYVKQIFVLFILITLSFIMNGRLIPAFLGYAILVSVFKDFINNKNKISIKNVILVISSLVLTMVSSGTMTVAFLYAFIMILAINHHRLIELLHFKSIFFIIVLLLPVVFRMTNYIMFMFFRNIDYFGGGLVGFINMFSHGLGRFLILTPFQTFAFFILAILGLMLNLNFIVKIYKSSRELFSVFLAINVALYGSLFGHSTGLMFIPPTIIYILYKF